MIIRIKRTSPADQVRLLSGPVHFHRNIHSNVYADLPQLLCCCLRHVKTNLVSGTDTDDKADFFPITLIKSIFTHHTARRFQKLFRLCRVIIVMLHIFIVVYITLQRSVGRHALTQDHRVNDGLTVNSITDCRYQILIPLPIIILEIEQNTAVIGSFHIVAGKSFFIRKGFCVLRGQKRQIQLTGLHLNGLCVVIRHNLENDVIDVRRALEIILILHQRNGLTLFPVCQHIRTGSYRMTEEIRLLHILTFQ